MQHFDSFWVGMGRMFGSEVEADRKRIFRFRPKNKNGRKSSLFFGRKQKKEYHHHIAFV